MKPRELLPERGARFSRLFQLPPAILRQRRQFSSTTPTEPASRDDDVAKGGVGAQGAPAADKGQTGRALESLAPATAITPSMPVCGT